MGFKQKYTIEKSYLPSGTKRRLGTKMPRVSFVVAHDTGNPTSTAMQNVTYYKNSCNADYASAHIFVDDKHIIECIPALTGTPEKAWHVMYNPTQDNIMFGSDADDTAIGVELCYGKNINFKTAYKRYTWVLAYICYKFGINPATHLTGHEFLDPTRKTDPTNALKTGDVTFKQLVKDVVKVYNECADGAKVSQTESASPVMYLNYTVTITTSSLNIRNDASLTAPIVGTLKKGTKVTATKKMNGMYCIGTNKWISANEEYSKHKNNPRGTVKILTDSLNIREKSNFNSKVVGKLAKGKKVKVYEKYNGLYHIGKSKWISANKTYVKFTAATSSTKKSTKAIGTIKIICDSLNIRKEPSFSSAVVGELIEGKTAKVYEEKNGLYRIGTNKWVSANAKYVKFSK